MLYGSCGTLCPETKRNETVLAKAVIGTIMRRSGSTPIKSAAITITIESGTTKRLTKKEGLRARLYVIVTREFWRRVSNAAPVASM